MVERPDKDVASASRCFLLALEPIPRLGKPLSAGRCPWHHRAGRVSRDPLPAPRLTAHRVRRGEVSGQGVILLRLLWSVGQLKGLPEHVERIRIERVGID